MLMPSKFLRLDYNSPETTLGHEQVEVKTMTNKITMKSCGFKGVSLIYVTECISFQGFIREILGVFFVESLGVFPSWSGMHDKM